jgi:hypothetical protein
VQLPFGLNLSEIGKIKGLDKKYRAIPAVRLKILILSAVFSKTSEKSGAKNEKFQRAPRQKKARGRPKRG